MIEHIPHKVENAFFYFHSAGTNSTELEPYLYHFIEKLPNTYIWAGDGVISDSPLLKDNLKYNSHSDKRYWFSFPMDDASSFESFKNNAQAVGASLCSSGASVNTMVDQIQLRFSLSSDKIILGGFQHGSSLALAASMMRIKDPFSRTILIEPYLLEAFYLDDEKNLPPTKVYCIDNRHIRRRTKEWINIETDKELEKFGLQTERITVKNGGDDLDLSMIIETINLIKNK